MDVRDLTGGFKCIRREVLEAIDLDSVRAEGYVFQIEVTYRALLAGFRVREVPIVFGDRTGGYEQDVDADRARGDAGWFRACAEAPPRRSPRAGSSLDAGSRDAVGL